MTNHAALRDMIASSPADDLPEILAKAGYVEVKLDPSLRDRQDPEPTDEVEKIAWPLLDTAYNLVRVAAVRTVLQTIRDESRAAGVELESDEKLFQQAKESGAPGAPTTYLELAPDSELAASAFYGVYSLLTTMSAEDAEEGLGRE